MMKKGEGLLFCAQWKEGGKDQLFELGPGAQIKAMVKRIDMGVWKAMRNISV